MHELSESTLTNTTAMKGGTKQMYIAFTTKDGQGYHKDNIPAVEIVSVEERTTPSKRRYSDEDFKVDDRGIAWLNIDNLAAWYIGPINPSKTSTNTDFDDLELDEEGDDD